MDLMGDFWSARNDLDFSSVVSGDTVTVTILNTTPFPIHQNVSLFAQNGRNLSQIIVQKENGQRIEYAESFINDSDKIIYGFTAN